MQRLLSLAIAVPVLALAGCGEKAPDVFQVTGTVSLDGQPLEGARVTLHLKRADGQTQARKPSGITDENGAVTIFYPMTKGPIEGAPPGNYMITVTKFKDSGVDPEMDEEAADALEEAELAKLDKKMRRQTGEEDDDDGTPDYAEGSLIPVEYGEPEMTQFKLTVAEEDGNSFELELAKKFVMTKEKKR